jgi:hypothetical protein
MKLLFNLLLLTSLFLFNSCDNETPSTVGGGGRIKFDISISPPLKNTDLFQVIGFAAGFAIATDVEGYSGEITPEYAVTKGQNVGVSLNISNTTSLECKTVTIKAILNGSVIDTKVLEMGVKQITPSQIFCKDGYSKSLNYIIP